MQYSRLRKIISETNDGNGETVTMSRDLFMRLLEAALRAKGTFDEKYYLSRYPDIQDAIRRKMIPNCASHYYMTGYLECRVPAKIPVDEKYYLAENPDISNAIKKGTLKSAQDHFEVSGLSEGRLPNSDFTLF